MPFLVLRDSVDKMQHQSTDNRLDWIPSVNEECPMMEEGKCL